MGLKSVLAAPSMYRAFVRLAGGNYRAEYVARYVRPCAGDRILDLGCGPGDVLDFLPPVTYLGVDMSSRYVEAARQRFGERGDFLCADACAFPLAEPASFDIVMANGLLHHLGDEQALALLRLAHAALRPGGRLVTFDGCFVPRQSPVARMLLRRDRGRFVRTLSGYQKLAAQVFREVQPHVRHDLLRIPYTHVILQCQP